MTPTLVPAVTPPCTTTAWYEVSPASVAAAAWSQAMASGSRITSSSRTATLLWKPPFDEVPGPSIAAGTATLSPTRKRDTPEPTTDTTPAISCPRVIGRNGSSEVRVPSRKPTSLWQSPAAFTSMTISPAPASGSGISCSERGCPTSVNCHAFMIDSFWFSCCDVIRASAAARTGVTCDVINGTRSRK